ncbi:DNA-3-methyladenine glycosylase 2 family protein [Halioglobus maricola]|uniref:DNA-3-methyladenine glycosylase II n=1 Tax=Halioglobus maricola TaxID=2601894 RepID=A0A5P9NFZ4_9GAMM|nr:AlkA N-terminal domain-containing protein [Halioglobus maricola]QFU74702.1 DNA-3-methyladenine glycosylase 2 family protein [Halioglobus maricola]
MELLSANSLDQQTCRRARLARDPRFDGEFFLAVRTTGIYCRPICPARPPAEKNVSYYRLASQAADAGYRPCLRCRPESAPGSPAWEGTTTTVDRALNLIREGALDHGSLADLAGRLGIGERYLRKLFEQELGVSPQAVAFNQRLLFAKKLLAETDMAITEIAFASGFGSVRRFNSALQEHFRLTPTQLRGRGKRGSADGTITLQLQYRPPYDWHGVIDFFAHHEITAIEHVSANSFRRHFLSCGKPAWLEVRPVKNRPALALTVDLPDHRELRSLVQRVRRMFDLDANPDIIQQSLGTSTELQPLLAQSPGSRSPGHWSLFEASVRAIVGQQVSTVAARSICSRFASACSTGEQPTFPTAAGLAALEDSEFPMPGRRRETLQALCTAFSGREDQLTLTDLASFKGVGPWTVAMAAIRGAGEPDVFPLGDLGLVKAWEALGGEKNALKTDCEQWSPWRSYAANLLWRSLSQ